MSALSSSPSAAPALRAARFSLPACSGFTLLAPQAVPHTHTEKLQVNFAGLFRTSCTAEPGQPLENFLLRFYWLA